MTGASCEVHIKTLLTEPDMRLPRNAFRREQWKISVVSHRWKKSALIQRGSWGNPYGWLIALPPLHPSFGENGRLKFSSIDGSVVKGIIVCGRETHELV